MNISAFSGFHKVNNNTRVSLLCDFSYFEFLGKRVIHKHLKTTSENKESDFVWTLDEESLYMLVWAEESIIFLFICYV